MNIHTHMNRTASERKRTHRKEMEKKHKHTEKGIRNSFSLSFSFDKKKHNFYSLRSSAVDSLSPGFDETRSQRLTKINRKKECKIK